MNGFKVLLISFVFIVGISGNNLWNYDMSNIIGDEEPIHITIDDGSGSDVSGQEYMMDTDFDELPESGVISTIKSLWRGFKNGFKRLVHSLRDGTYTIENYHRALERFNADVDNMTAGDSLGGVNFNPFIGMIRFVTGDLVFYEIFIVFSIGITMVWLKVSMLVIRVVRLALSAFPRLVPSLRNVPGIGWLINKFI